MIKTRFKNCSKEIKQRFSETKCILPISVGQKCHEEKYFPATIELINQHFKECTIMICDSLQRHTIQMTQGCSTQQAYKLAIGNGDEWIKHNQKTYEQLTIPYNIMRWNTWLHTKEYVKQRALTDDLYRTNNVFQDATTNDAKSFLKRQSLAEDNLHYCLEHILEECSIMPLWTVENFAFIIYPSHQIKSLFFAHKTFVEPYFPNLLTWIRIDFKN